MIGFDIGGTKCAVSIGEQEHDRILIKEKKVFSTDLTRSPYEVIDTMCALAETMTDDFSRIGISCGGPLDSKRGIIMSPPNLTGWDEVPIVAYIKEKYHGRVALQNDANACALAEWQYGAGKGTKNMIFLTCGSGLGAGLILNGQLYTGTNDMAGEVGHIRLNDYGPVGYGKAGSFEGFCSGNGIAALGRSMAIEKLQMGQPVSYCTGLETLAEVSAKSIAECADAGYEDALEVYRISGDKMGAGIAILIDILNPERVVIGSVFQRSGHLLREAMEKRIRKECLIHTEQVCRVVPAALTENIGDYAALSVAGMEE